MIKIFDRTIKGTLVLPSQQHLGRQADRRLAENKRKIQQWLSALPAVEIKNPLSRGLYRDLAGQLETQLALPANKLALQDTAFRSYRKETQLTAAALQGEPWAILKIFADQKLSPAILRAFSEAEGCRDFSAVAGVVAPRLHFACRLTGKAVPPFTVLTGESVVSGSPFLNWLETGKMKAGQARQQFLLQAAELAKRCAAMIHKVHSSSLPKENGDILSPDELANEAGRVIDGLSGVAISNEDAIRAQKYLRANTRCVQQVRLVRAHRDYTTNNILYSDADNTIGIIDLEKSGREYPGKDISKFTESLLIDGKNIGLGEDEIEHLGETFVRAYCERSAWNDIGGFWRMVRFYQLYSVISFLAYDPANESRVATLTARLRNLLRS